MSWQSLPADFRELCERDGFLTDKQLEAIKWKSLALDHSPPLGNRWIARQIGISVRALRDRLDAANAKLIPALEEIGQSLPPELEEAA